MPEICNSAVARHRYYVLMKGNSKHIGLSLRIATAIALCLLNESTTETTMKRKMHNAI